MKDAVTRSASNVATGSTKPAKNASTTTDGVEDNENNNHQHDARPDGY